MGVASNVIILIFMFIVYILHCKSDKKITYIKIASIWSDLVARGMFISLIKIDQALGGISNRKIKLYIFCSFNSCKNLEILLQKRYFYFKNGIFYFKNGMNLHIWDPV